MPQVPYNPVPNVAPADIATPTTSVNTPIAAFGGTVGEALKGLGSGVEHTGGELMRRALALQELKNETEAKEADAQYMQVVGKLHTEFSSLEGINAVNAQDKYNKDLQEARVNIRKSLSNDAARRMYDGPSLSTMGRTIFNGAGHAGQQMKVAADNASNARISAINDHALQFPDDEVGFKRSENAIRGEIESKADIKGWMKDQTDDQMSKAVSSLWAHRIVGKSKTAPFEADEMLRENRDKLRADDFEKVDNTVRSQARSTGSRMIADQVTAGLSDTAGKGEQSLQDMLDEGRKLAAEKFPNDPVMKDYVDQKVQQKWNQHKTSVRDFDFENTNTVQGALNGAVGGKIPTSVEELTALDPKVGIAWDALTEAKKKGFMAQLTKNAKGDVSWSPERIREFNRLRGEANDPESSADFIYKDLSGVDLPISARLQLSSLQQQLKNKAGGDPRINRAISNNIATLKAAGIDKARNPDEYFQFRGALQDALDNYQQEHKKAPNYKEEQEIVSRLLQQTTTPGSVFGDFWPNKEELYKISVPTKIMDKELDDPRWKGKDRSLAEKMIQREYVSQQYQKLFGKAKSEGSDSKKPQ